MCVINDLDVSSIETKYSYKLGDTAKPSDMKASYMESKSAYVLLAASLEKGDGAFVRRSDGTWRFAIVAHKELSQREIPRIDLYVNKKGSKKCLPLKGWASNIRIFNDSHANQSRSNLFINPLAYMDIAREETNKAHISDSDEEFLVDDSQRTFDPALFTVDDCINNAAASESVGHDSKSLSEMWKGCHATADEEKESRPQEESKANQSDQIVCVGRRTSCASMPCQSVKLEQKGSGRIHRRATTLTNSFQKMRQSLSRSPTKNKSAEAIKFQSLFEEWMQKM